MEWLCSHGAMHTHLRCGALSRQPTDSPTHPVVQCTAVFTVFPLANSTFQPQPRNPSAARGARGALALDHCSKARLAARSARQVSRQVAELGELEVLDARAGGAGVREAVDADELAHVLHDLLARARRVRRRQLDHLGLGLGLGIGG